MKVQHGAKWVSTTAGWGANDKTAPWARCCCGYLCQGIWQLAECLTCAIFYGIYLRTREVVLLSLFRSVSLLACSFLLLLYSYGLLAWLLGNKDYLLEVHGKTVIIIIVLMWVWKQKDGRESDIDCSTQWVVLFPLEHLAKGVHSIEPAEQSPWNLLNTEMLMTIFTFMGRPSLHPHPISLSLYLTTYLQPVLHAFRVF